MSGLVTVLVVEDEFAIADLLEMVLADEGYHVVTASDGREGLQRLAENPVPALVISDLMMPILDGATMLQTMRATEGQRDIPCIIMSSMPEENVRARVAAYTAFVRKPFRLAFMIELVATVLATSKPER